MEREFIKKLQILISAILNSIGLIVCFILFIIGWVRCNLIVMVGTGFLMVGFDIGLIFNYLRINKEE